MNLWIAAVLGLVVGATLTWLYAAGRLSVLATERRLLRERVVDLEAAVTDDAQTAAALLPLRDALGRVERQVGTLERDRVDQYSALRTVMNRVEQETSALGAQTRTLAGSLNASTVRGAWGEVQLRRVLELAGLLARCDFEEQVRAVSRHDRSVRPDVVVRLPGNKVLVVDAKAPMTAFLSAQAEDLDDSERGALLREHAGSLKGHVNALADKAYWSAFETTPEMVVCFVPTEAMLSAALAADPALHESAMARRVVLVGPAALLALLRTVAFTWQQDALTANALELLSVGRELHERLATLGSHVTGMGRALTRSVESYNQLVGALESRVLVTARRMTDLGMAGDPLVRPAPVETGPRVLTAYELIEAATAEDDRPALDFELPLGPRQEGLA
jgi:DNA recombination protein RmuC